MGSGSKMVSGGAGGGLAGPIDVEVLASSLPDRVATGTGDISVTVLPNYLRAVLECVAKRKAMRYSAELQREKMRVMECVAEQNANVAKERIRSEREVKLAKAGYGFMAQIKGIEAYRAMQIEAIRSGERVQMRAIDAQFDSQLREVEARYRAERHRVDREWDAFEMLLEEGRRRYRDAARQMRLKEQERRRLVRELEGTCAYFLGRVRAGDPAAMGSYLALVNIRVSLLEGGGSVDRGLDSLIERGLI